ncbi:hypothetical protein [Streptomyces lydicus]|uniref:hypothetical protein n=1 Tax=Streptomyces lydicus TaxID=47763 RepID=UPI00379A66A2
MTPIDRLMAEELPTGTFGGGTRTDTRRRSKPADASGYSVANPTSATQAAEHRRALIEALDSTGRRANKRRHLHAVTDQHAA